MKFIYHYDIAALLVSIVILFNIFLKQRIKTRVSKSFKILAVDLFLSITFDLITIFSITYYTNFPIWLNYILNIISLITYNLLPVFYISSISRSPFSRTSIRRELLTEDIILTAPLGPTPSTLSKSRKIDLSSALAKP